MLVYRRSVKPVSTTQRPAMLSLRHAVAHPLRAVSRLLVGRSPTGVRLSSPAVMDMDRRTLFGDAVLGIDTFLHQRQRLLREQPDVTDERARILATAVAGQEPLLTEDVRKMVTSAEGKAAVEEAGQVLRAYMQNVRSVGSLSLPFKRSQQFLLRDFLQLCHHHRADVTASEFWQERVDAMGEETFMRMVHDCPFFLPSIYFDLLYKADRYEDVLLAAEAMARHVTFEVPNLLVVPMAAALRLNTPDAFERATGLVKSLTNPNRSQLLGRVATIYSYLASKQGHDVLAMEMLQLQTIVGIIYGNLKIYYLCRLGRFDEAFGCMERIVETPGGPDVKLHKKKAAFLLPVVQEMTDCVEKSGDQQLQQRLSTLFAKLDSVAVIVETEIEAFLLTTIEKAERTADAGGDRNRRSDTGGDWAWRPRHRGYDDGQARQHYRQDGGRQPEESRHGYRRHDGGRHAEESRNHYRRHDGGRHAEESRHESRQRHDARRPPYEEDDHQY